MPTMLWCRAYVRTFLRLFAYSCKKKRVGCVVYGSTAEQVTSVALCRGRNGEREAGRGSSPRAFTQIICARSSTGKSNRLRTCRLGVRLSSSAPNCRGIAKLVKARAFEVRKRRFESYCPHHEKKFEKVFTFDFN